MNCKYKSTMTKKKAFTLIELLIVIAIIGILFIVLVSKVDFATDKAKATGVQTDFRSFQMALEAVSKEKAGFNSFGWNTGDDNANGVRDSVDEGDTNEDGVYQDGEIWTGHKKYLETWTNKYSLIRPGTTFETDGYDKDAIFALETAINKNLDPKLHITIDAKTGLITMANGAQDPWDTQYHGAYISAEDGMDRGAIVMYSNGANQKFGSEHSIANGVPKVIVPGNNKNGADDCSMVVVYTYTNGYGEVGNLTTGFSNNQEFLTGNGGNEPDVDEPIPVVAGATFDDGTTLTWEQLQLPENGNKYDYSASAISDTDIGEKAFDGCTSLTSIAIPDSVTSIGYYAFHKCTGLTSITIPNGVTNMGSYAIYDCDSLISVIIGDGVTNMGDGAVSYCDSLTSIVIGNSVTDIGSSAFRGCTSLTSVTIPDSVINMGTYAFDSCTMLTSVTIGSGLTYIRSYTFRNCDSLTNITFNGSREQWDAVIKGSHWELSPATYVQCTDGKYFT